jgi:prolipoprotein diacylglyceryl transferase
MVLASINWNVDPEIFRIGPIAVRYYGVLWALAFYLGYIIFNQFVKREKLPQGFLDSLVMYAAVGTIIGARLGHCLFYQPDYYLKHPIDIIKIWEGGLASHGAAIGILIAMYLFARKQKMSMVYVLDRVVITVAIGVP